MKGAYSNPATPPAGINIPNQKIALNKGVLTLHATLQRADYNQFQRACNELASSAHREITLDLSRSTYASSIFIGILVDVVTRMKTDGKDVTVFVSAEIGKLLHMAHLYHLFTYQIVQPPADA